MARCASSRTRVIAFVFLVSLACIPAVSAQQPQPSASALTPVPRFIWFNGVFRPADGGPAAPIETATIAVYQERNGGGALWQETQAIAIAADGRYNVLLGSSSSDGLPPDLFTSGEPRWIGITFARAGEGEQPRVTLASVPYAIKAADADTLGGKPASAFRLADPAAGAPAEVTAGDGLKPVLPTVSASGTPGYLGVFTGTESLGNSTLFQSGSRLGQGTTSPMDALHVAFTDAGGAITGYAVQNFSATGYSGMLFYDQAGATSVFQGFGNASHEYRINNVASSGTINFLIGASSKFKIANSGNVGIGVAAPGSTLDVGGDINMTGVLRQQGTTVLSQPGVNSLGVGKAAFGNNSNTGIDNTAVGFAALQSNTIGFYNTAIGSSTLSSNTTGGYNTAIGRLALSSNMTGDRNTAIGGTALALTDIGADNTAIGFGALQFNTGSVQNTAIGSFTMNNTTGPGAQNTAIGFAAMEINTTGSLNTAIGRSALHNNTTASTNTAIGVFTLGSNNIGNANTAVGYAALAVNTTASQNTAVGWGALQLNSIGAQNTAVGNEALNAVTGAGNIGIGNFAGRNLTTDSDNIDIGNQGVSGDSGVIRIGTPGTQTTFFAAGVGGVAVSGVPVLIDLVTGKLGTIPSSRRYKDDIQDMGDASRGLLRLRPVTFRYKAPFDDGSTPMQYGLIAEEVAEVYPDLVAHSVDGQIETVKYQVLDVLLLNEVQRQHADMLRQRADIDALTNQNRDLQQRLAALEAALRERQ